MKRMQVALNLDLLHSLTSWCKDNNALASTTVGRMLDEDPGDNLDDFLESTLKYHAKPHETQVSYQLEDARADYMRDMADEYGVTPARLNRSIIAQSLVEAGYLEYDAEPLSEAQQMEQSEFSFGPVVNGTAEKPKEEAKSHVEDVTEADLNEIEADLRAAGLVE